MSANSKRIATEHYPETGILRQVGGVGALTALSLMLILEDPSRFKKSRAVGAYLGLVPGEDRSGESDP
jgi:transposase